MNFAIGLSVIIFVVLLVYFSILKNFKKLYAFYNYQKVLSLFEYFLNKSYELTYENSIVTWLSNGIQNMPSEEKETIERDFIKQTFLLMGVNNHTMIRDFFGNDSYLINFMILFIRKKISNDGLANVIKNANREDVQIIR